MTFALIAVGKMYKSWEFIEDSVSLQSKYIFEKQADIVLKTVFGDHLSGHSLCLWC